jgi:hypothetical protein
MTCRERSTSHLPWHLAYCSGAAPEVRSQRAISRPAVKVPPASPPIAQTCKLGEFDNPCHFRSMTYVEIHLCKTRHFFCKLAFLAKWARCIGATISRAHRHRLYAVARKKCTLSAPQGNVASSEKCPIWPNSDCASRRMEMIGTRAPRQKNLGQKKAIVLSYVFARDLFAFGVFLPLPYVLAPQEPGGQSKQDNRL